MNALIVEITLDNIELKELEITTVQVNTDKEQLLSNIKSSASLNLSRLDVVLKPHKQRAIIVCGGPSLRNNKVLRKIRSLANNSKYYLFTMNGAHDFLLSKGIVSDYCVVFDACKEIADLIEKPIKRTTYLVASRCDPNLFKKLEGGNIILWDANDNVGEQQLLSDLKIKWLLIGGGVSAGLRTLSICYILGYRQFEIFGMDSCIDTSDAPPEPNLDPTEAILERDHGYNMPPSVQKLRGEQGDGKVFWVKVGEKYWLISAWMHLQKNNYIELVPQLHNVKIKHHTWGLIPYIHKLIEEYSSE